MTFVSNHGLYPSGTYYPFVCDISSVTKGMQTIVETTEDHGFVVGNQVYFSIPKEYGMTQLSQLKSLILNTTSNTITVDINSTEFNDFAIPSPIFNVVIDPAVVIGIGSQNTGYVNTSNPTLQIPGSYRNTYP